MPRRCSSPRLQRSAKMQIFQAVHVGKKFSIKNINRSFSTFRSLYVYTHKIVRCFKSQRKFGVTCQFLFESKSKENMFLKWHFHLSWYKLVSRAFQHSGLYIVFPVELDYIFGPEEFWCQISPRSDIKCALQYRFDVFVQSLQIVK